MLELAPHSLRDWETFYLIVGTAAGAASATPRAGSGVTSPPASTPRSSAGRPAAPGDGS